MRKFTRLMLTLTLCVFGLGVANATRMYAKYGTPANQGNFDAETGTYTWTESYSNLMTIFEFPNGELATYKSLHFTTSNYTDVYRICFMNGSSAIATIAFYSAGEKNLVLSERNETKDLDLSKITHISFGGSSKSGSIVISSRPYLQKPMELFIDDSGKAEINATDLTASGCLTLNDETGELTSTLGEDGAPTWGRLSINFPAEGVDLSALTAFTVNYSGTVLFNNFEIGGKGFWSNVMGRGDLANYMSDSAIGDATKVTNWRWNVDKAGTQTITSITLQFATMNATNPHETLLTNAMYSGNSESHFGEVMGQGATIYGMGSNIDGSQYVDLSDYDEMRIYGTPGKSIRMLFNYDQTAPIKTDVTGNLDENGYFVLDLSTLAAQKLNAFKFPWDGASGVINKIILYKENIPVAYSYVISGSGAATPSVTVALADADATSIDATGLTNTSAIALESVNPNCLFIAESGKLSNAKNVIVNGICANLELTDQKPFKAPVDFTATAASFSKTVTDADYATLVLPFNAALPTGVEAYNATSVTNSVINTTAAESIVANKPVLLKNAGDYEFTAENVEVAAVEGVQTNGLLNGVYATTDVPTDNGYVLQNQGGNVKFFKAIAGTTVKAFRAYLAANNADARLGFDFETTGIKKVENAAANNGEFFNLAGQRVAQPTKGLYIMNGKKFIK